MAKWAIQKWFFDDEDHTASLIDDCVNVTAPMSCRPFDLSTCLGAALLRVTGAEAPAQ